MVRISFLLVVLCGLGWSTPARGADGWERLKLGMTTEDAEAMLGAPLIRNQGKGFEKWIYDGRAEVLFYGGVIAWTAPASSPAAHSPTEVWQFYQAIPNRPQDPIPLRLPILLSRPPAPAEPDLGSGFRYRQRH
jgi:hypothetical protein